MIHKVNYVSFYERIRMIKSNNPSAIRSRKFLTDALLNLMKKKPFHDITISELVKTADITRKTFYRNYDSKEDIITDYLDQLFNEYILCLSSFDTFTKYNALTSYFTFCKQYESFLLLLIQQELIQLLYKRYQNYLIIIQQNFQSELQVDSISSEYHIAYSMGGFFQILIHWIQTGARQTPEELVQICFTFLPS